MAHSNINPNSPFLPPPRPRRRLATVAAVSPPFYCSAALLPSSRSYIDSIPTLQVSPKHTPRRNPSPISHSINRRRRRCSPDAPSACLRDCKGNFNPDSPLLRRMPPTNDLGSFLSLLDWCCAAKSLRHLQMLHAGAIKSGFSHKYFARAKLVAAYASCGQMNDAHLIFSFSDRRPTFLYNTLIRGYSNLGRFRLSLSTFSQMLAARKPIDGNTLPAVLRSVAGLSALAVGRRVHLAVLVNGFASDPAHCNALITMYAKCGDLQTARKVFDKTPERNAVSWSAMMGGFAVHGRFLEMCEVFERMVKMGFRPDGVAFGTVLSGCSHGGLVEKGKEYFEMMKRFGVKPNMVHYTCMVDMLGKAGRVEEAQKLVESMEVVPDEALWRAYSKARERGDVVVRRC